MTKDVCANANDWAIDGALGVVGLCVGSLFLFFLLVGLCVTSLVETVVGTINIETGLFVGGRVFLRFGFDHISISCAKVAAAIGCAVGSFVLRDADSFDLLG